MNVYTFRKSGFQNMILMTIHLRHVSSANNVNLEKKKVQNYVRVKFSLSLIRIAVKLWLFHQYSFCELHENLSFNDT